MACAAAAVCAPAARRGDGVERHRDADGTRRDDRTSRAGPTSTTSCADRERTSLTCSTLPAPRTTACPSPDTWRLAVTRRRTVDRTRTRRRRPALPRRGAAHTVHVSARVAGSTSTSATATTPLGTTGDRPPDRSASTAAPARTSSTSRRATGDRHRRPRRRPPRRRHDAQRPSRASTGGGATTRSTADGLNDTARAARVGDDTLNGGDGNDTLERRRPGNDDSSTAAPASTPSAAAPATTPCGPPAATATADRRPRRRHLRRRRRRRPHRRRRRLRRHDHVRRGQDRHGLRGPRRRTASWTTIIDPTDVRERHRHRRGRSGHDRHHDRDHPAGHRRAGLGTPGAGAGARARQGELRRPHAAGGLDALLHPPAPGDGGQPRRPDPRDVQGGVRDLRRALRRPHHGAAAEARLARQPGRHRHGDRASGAAPARRSCA